jgi:hypothetical protein
MSRSRCVKVTFLGSNHRTRLRMNCVMRLMTNLVLASDFSMPSSLSAKPGYCDANFAQPPHVRTEKPEGIDSFISN